MRLPVLFAAMAGALLAGAASAQPAPAAVPAAPDYAQDSAWLCRPGRIDVCDAPLDVLAQENGARVVRRFAEAANPPVDCFYVYPTVSTDQSALSDLTPGPEETRATVGQAARFASRCRLFAPVYRQVTLFGLTQALRSGAASDRDFTTPYADVLAAWRDYLRRDNGGRGVVVIGHSQGAILLARLLQEEIARDPAQRRLLVSAILAGHPGLPVREGAVGQSPGATPLCRSADQFGCALAWSTYAQDDTSVPGFGRSAAADAPAACTNPAALAGGSAPLRSYLRRPPGAPETDPPYLEAETLIAECVSANGATVLRVRPAPGADVASLQRVFAAYGSLPGWGLHSLDLTLPQGTLLDLVDRQTRAWAAARR